jgi:hypothetical protein
VSKNFCIAPYVLFRIAALPLSALSILRGGRAAQIDLELQVLSANQRKEADKLCDRLYARISGETNRALRLALLKAKRAIFNCDPVDVDTAALICTSSPSLGNQLSSWNSGTASYAQLSREGEDALAREYTNLPRALRVLWSHSPLRASIAVAQPRLYRILSTEMDKPQVSSRLTKSERTFLSYCYRSGTKTSPFSAFANIAYGFLDTIPVKQRAARLDSIQSEFTIRIAVLRKLILRLLQEPFVLESAPMRANPTNTKVGQEIICVAASASFHEGVFSSKEFVGAVDYQPLLTLIVNALTDTNNVAERNALLRQISDASTTPLATLECVLAKLVKAGLLSPATAFDFTSTSALEKWLAQTLATPPEISSAFFGIEELLDTFDINDPASIATGISELQLRLDSLFKFLRMEERADEATLLNHKTYYSMPREVSTQDVSIFEKAFQRISGILPLFNTQFSWNAELTDFFIKRHGRSCAEENPISLYYEFSNRFPAGKHPFSTLDSELPVVNLLTNSRNSLLGELRNLAATADDSIELTAEFFDRWTTNAEPFRTSSVAASAAFLGQIYPDDLTSQSRFVLNKVITGYGMMQASWASSNPTNAGGARLRFALEKTIQGLSENIEFVELVGNFGFDGQLHPRITPRCIIYPGEANLLARASIDWLSLGVKYEAEWNRVILFDKSTVRTIMPLHFGTLSPIFFPPFYRFINALGPCFAPDLSLLEFLEMRVSDDERSKVRVYPRITHDTVVLLRRSWCIPVNCLPQLNGLSPFDRFRGLRGWARKLNLPQHVFVTPMLTSELVQRPHGGTWPSRLRKPFFVDWDAYSSHEIFDRFARAGTGTVVITEMLPMISGNQPGSNEADTVTEAVFDLYWN